MIITYVWDSEYPWDVRVEKICRALVASGHEVHVLARNRDAQPAREAREEGTIHRLAWRPRWGRGPNVLSQFPAFFNPSWIHLLRRTIRATAAQAVICRDLPLAPTAVRVARACGVPMLLDMAESYPAMLEDLWRSGRPRPWDHVVRNPRLAAAVEKWVVQRADHVLVVVEESRERVVALGADPRRVTIVSNTPPRQQLAPRPELRPLEPDGVLDVVYVGQLDAPSRGLEVLVRAVAACNRRGRRVRATLVGDGRERENLVALAEEVGTRPGEVRFTGRLAHEKALGILTDCHVGVVPHLASEHTDTTVANKLFDYMSAGLAVVASSARPLARIVRDSACGEVAASGDAEGMARAIERLCDDAYRYRCALSGWNAVAATYHWERDVERLEAALRG